MLIQFQAYRGAPTWTYHGWIIRGKYLAKFPRLWKKTFSRYRKPKSISFFSLGTANRRTDWSIVSFLFVPRRRGNVGRAVSTRNDNCSETNRKQRSFLSSLKTNATASVLLRAPDQQSGSRCAYTIRAFLFIHNELYNKLVHNNNCDIILILSCSTINEVVTLFWHEKINSGLKWCQKNIHVGLDLLRMFFMSRISCQELDSRRSKSWCDTSNSVTWLRDCIGLSAKCDQQCLILYRYCLNKIVCRLNRCLLKS